MLPIERSRLQFFAKAIGETDPVYTDEAAARDAGYPDLPAPPTFLFAAELDSGAAFRLIEDLQIPIAKLLHGEQSFTYHRPACVGDTVTVRSTHQRHLRQEERRARIRRQDLARHQPAAANWWPSCARCWSAATERRLP